jgi:hypothetical protein
LFYPWGIRQNLQAHFPSTYFRDNIDKSVSDLLTCLVFLDGYLLLYQQFTPECVPDPLEYLYQKPNTSPNHRSYIWLLLNENIDHFGILVYNLEDFVENFSCPLPGPVVCQIRLKGCFKYVLNCLNRWEVFRPQINPLLAIFCQSAIENLCFELSDLY